MKHLHLLGALGAALLATSLAGCKTSSEAHNHWHIDSVGTSITHQFFGSIPEDYAVFKEEASQGVQDFNWTLRRHLLNDNPGNPLQPAPQGTTQPPPQPPDIEFTVGGE